MQLSRFLRDRAGNMGIMLALSALPLLLAAGASIDIMRQVDTDTLLQSAADAAVLAGGTNKDHADQSITNTVDNYLKSNGAEAILNTITKIEHGKTVEGNFFVRIQGTIETSFMAVAGLTSMNVGAYSEMHAGGQAAEIALVLDNTGSMNDDGKLAALKTAAKGLIAQVFAGKTDDTYLKAGIVPFAQYVNVGTDFARKQRQTVDGPYTYTSTVGWLKFGNQDPVTYQNCTYPPGDVVSACQTIYYSGGEGQSGGSYQSCQHSLPPVCKDETYNHSWNGCVGSRQSGSDVTVGDANNRNPYPAIWDVGCTQPITDLTSDTGTLNGQIDAMVATGETYIPGGLIWGWNLLDPSDPYASAKPADDGNGHKVKKYLVLMTDGANTIYPEYTTSDYSPQANHISTQDGNSLAATDSRMITICNNIKGAGITIFTVGLGVDQAKQGLLDSCASDSQKAFQSRDNEQLLAAFADIGSQLQQIALTK